MMCNFPLLIIVSVFKAPNTKKFLHDEGNYQQSTDNPTEQEEVFTSYTSEKKLLSRTFKEVQKLNNKEIKLPKSTNGLMN